MWTHDVSKEVLEIFAEAQRPLLEQFCLRFVERRLQRKRLGFNRKAPEHGYYARQRARYSHWKITRLEPSATLVCVCGYRAHTPQQLFQHKRGHFR